MKKTLSYTVVFALIFTLVYGSLSYAASDSQQLKNVNYRIWNTQSQLNKGKKEEKKLSSQIASLDSKINKTQLEMNKIQSNIYGTQNKIFMAQQQLVQKKQDIGKKNVTLNNRLRVIYKNGEIGFLEILLGADSFGDFLTNLDMVKKIYEQDVNLLKSLKRQCQQIAAAKTQLVQLQAQLSNQNVALDQKKDELDADRGEAATLRSQVRVDNKELEDQIDELNKEADAISDRIRRTQSKESYIGGVFTWPAPGHTTITSPFGYRTHPILKVKKLHTGIDISCSSGSKVVAANKGTVIHAGWLGGYGNAVMIDHGGGIVTLYAHNSSLLVSVGQKVSKGQQISRSGSTGMSTGPHLHFEVRVNGDYKNPMGWL